MKRQHGDMGSQVPKGWDCTPKTVGQGVWPILKGYFLVTGRVDRKGERAFLYKRLRALA